MLRARFRPCKTLLWQGRSAVSLLLGPLPRGRGTEDGDGHAVGALLYSTLGGAGEAPHTRYSGFLLSSSSLNHRSRRPSSSTAPHLSSKPPSGSLHFRRRRPLHPQTLRPAPPTLSTRACSAAFAAGRGVGGFVAPQRRPLARPLPGYLLHRRRPVSPSIYSFSQYS
jgi:hypothetical protein